MNLDSPSMVVASVDEDKIIVAGPIHAGTLAMFGMLGDSSEGFTCIYANADQAKAIQLRTGDPITITGKLTGWETMWSTSATLQDCQFKSP